MNFHWIGKLFSPEHTHKYELKFTQEEMWAECECKHQVDIPPEREEEAYAKIRNRDWSWTV